MAAIEPIRCDTSSLVQSRCALLVLDVAVVSCDLMTGLGPKSARGLGRDDGLSRRTREPDHEGPWTRAAMAGRREMGGRSKRGLDSSDGP